MIIENTNDLQRFCNNLLNSHTGFIAVDTEFISSSQYRCFPKLCLIQIGYEGGAAVIDVLARNIDLSILSDILFNPNILKVFHDFQQDILALLSVFDYIPYPLMDTQMMAMLCRSYSSSIGYSELVYSLLDVKLSKESKRTDWILRPLSEQQINYALSDVTYLCLVYRWLEKKLKNLNRIEWLKEDIALMGKNLAIPYTSKNEGGIIVRRILSEYRDHDKLLDNVSDSKIYRVSYAKPLSKGRLTEVVVSKYIDEFCDAVLSRQQSCDISRVDKPKMYLIQAIIQQFCLDNMISYQLMSSSSEIVRMINNDLFDVRLANGWRYQQIGRGLINLLQNGGELSVLLGDSSKPLVFRGC